MPEQKQTIVNALPTEGEITYGELRLKLVTQGDEGALEQFHAMRRKGEVATRLDVINGVLTLLVSRA